MTDDELHLQNLLRDYKKTYEGKKNRLAEPARRMYLMYMLETLMRLKGFASEPVLLKHYIGQCIIDTEKMLYFLKTA